jgi:hypothetical protein
MILDPQTRDVTNIMEESIILESIVRPINIHRIYAGKDIVGEVLAEIERLQSD